jgi:hypothetical protein
MRLFKHLIESVRDWYQTDPPGGLEEADAMILSSSLIGASSKGMQQTRLLLQVTPKYGRNYIVEFEEYFPENELSGLTSGIKIKIHYQRNNPTKIIWKSTISNATE